MKQSVLRRVLSVLLCVSLLLGVSVVRPQKAEAFAISASVVASVIMIMTACGVTFWASTQGDAESYISEKLGEYLDQLSPSPASILDWLGITDLGSLFVVLTGGVARFDSNVVNPILDFVRWFNSEEDVDSGGPSLYYPARDIVVVQDRGLTSSGQNAQHGTISAVSDGEDTVVVTFNSLYSQGATVYPRIAVKIPDSTQGKTWKGSVTAPNLVANSSQFNVSFATFDPELGEEPPVYLYSWVNLSNGRTFQNTNSYGNTYLVICIKPNSGAANAANGAARFVFREHVFGEPRTRVSPSEVVAVPDDVSEGETFDVSPSVSLPADSSVDDTAALIFDGVVSQDGLSSDSSIYSPPLVDLSGIESRLDAIEAALIALDSAVDSVDGVTSDIQGSIATLLSRASSIQNSIATLDNNLDNVDDNVNDVALAVSGISGKIDNLESDVAGLVGSLGSISQGNSDIQDSIAGLISAMSSLSADMELVKDALAGLTANDSLVDDVADIKTNTSGLSGFLSSIQYYIERVLDVLSDFFTGFFDNLASAFIDLINSLKAMLLDLFIPDEAFVDAYVSDLQFKMDNHFSILSYPFSLLGRFIGESALQAEGDGILSWPDIYEPFSHTLLIHAGSYRLYDVVDEYGPNFYRAYDLYRIVLQGYITFDFISYLYFWFCDVFKMRELDFPNPLEVEE